MRRAKRLLGCPFFEFFFFCSSQLIKIQKTSIPTKIWSFLFCLSFRSVWLLGKRQMFDGFKFEILDKLAKFYKILFSGTSKCGCFWASSILTCNFCSRPAFTYLQHLKKFLKSSVISSKWLPLYFQLIPIQKSCWNTPPCISRLKPC